MRRILLLFVLLCFGTYLSAQSILASFTVDAVAKCAQQTIQFTDLSTSSYGTITGWAWSFGDGYSSRDQHPSHTYAKPGRYDVSLIVADNAGHTDTVRMSEGGKFIYMLPFIDYPSTYLMCNPVTLSDRGPAQVYPEFPYSYEWSGGQTTPSITTSTAGTYTVSLTQCGQTVNDTVTVKAPTGTFAIDTLGDIAYTINNDSALVIWNISNPFPAGTKFEVDYGNGITLNSISNRYAYYRTPAIAGKTITATVTAHPGTDVVSYSCDTTTSRTITFRQPYLKLDSWNGKDTTITTGDTLVLKNANVGANLSWSLPVSSTDSFIYITQPGTYYVSLSKGGDQAFESVTVRTVQKLTSDFTYANDPCDSLFVIFNFSGVAPSNDKIVSYEWSIHDSVIAVSSKNIGVYIYGTQPVTLKVTTASGRTATKTVNVNGGFKWTITASIDTTYNCGESARLRAITNAPAGQYTLYWSNEIGEGVDTTNVTTSGVYVATLIDRCRNGRGSSQVTVHLSKTPVISAVSDTLRLADYNDDNSYSWYRNDTLVGAGGILYDAVPGIYKVVLSNGTCTKTSAPFNFGDYHPLGIATNVQRDYAVCGFNRFILTGSATAIPAGDAIADYKWTFENGDTVHAQKVTRELLPGARKVVFQITTANGIVDVMTTTIDAPAYTIKANLLSYNVCKDSATLEAIATASDRYNIRWDDSTTNQIAYVGKSGWHHVYLQDSCGHTYAADSVLVTLKARINPYIELRDKADNDTLMINPQGKAYYKWFLNDYEVILKNNSYFANPQAGTYIGEVSDSGCYTTTAPFVYQPAPHFTAAIDAYRSPCDSSLITFTANYTNLKAGDSVISYSYNFGDLKTDSGNAIVTHKYEYNYNVPNRTVTLTLKTLLGYTSVTTTRLRIPLVDSVGGHLTLVGDNCTDSVIINLIQDYGTPAMIQWSTGETTKSITVKKSGTYSFQMQDSCQLHTYKGSITVNVGVLFQKPELVVSAKLYDTIKVSNRVDSYTYKIYKNGTLYSSNYYIVSPAAGTYVVEASNGNGCTARDTLVYVPQFKVVFVEVWPESTCDSSHWGFLANVVNAPAGVDYGVYDYGDGTRDGGGGHTYTQSGIYKVSRTAYGPNGEVATDTVTINVVLPDASNAFTPTLTLVGDTLKASPVNPGFTYAWYQGNTSLPVTTPYYIPTATNNYTVNITNNKGCVRSVSLPFNYNPNAKLTVDFVEVGTPSVCDSSRWSFLANVSNVPTGDQLTDSGIYDYGDGTRDYYGGHQYTAAGTYKVSKTATTVAGVVGSDTIIIHVVMKDAVTINTVRGIQDTLFATPQGHDASWYTVKWYHDGATLSSTDWFLIPDGAGTYTVTILSMVGCDASANLDYTLPVAATGVTPPAPGADSLTLSADFNNVTFNDNNTFTVELTTNNSGGRTLTEGEVVNLGTVKGTDPTSLTVAIPDDLACASNYTVRITSSAPVATTAWSSTFTITNQPAQPVITQVGDSLFTSSPYDLQWYQNDNAIDGATVAAIRAKANGTYRVAALNGTGCYSLSDARSVVITAIGDMTLGANTVTAYPNPSEGQVYLKFGYPISEKVKVSVYNLQGSVVYATTTIQQQTLLDLTTLPKGYYLVEITGYGTKKVLSIILH